MNSPHEPNQPDREPPMPIREQPGPVQTAVTPEAVRAARLARHGNDVSLPVTRARGVEWVRPTDLMVRHAATLSGRGIDFQAELARRTRAPIATGMGRLGKGARRLPPLSAFGRSGVTGSGPVRSGVGMS